MMKRIFVIFMAILLCANTASGIEWKEMNSDHFIIHFLQDEDFAKNVLDKAEYYYKTIATDLGYPRYSEFWLWDDRAKIYIYQNHATYLKATGEAEWTHGIADYTNKFIASYEWSGEFIDSILPHELAHLIFRDFVGFTGEIPLWLDEGVAQWAEVERRDKMKSMVKDLYEQDMLLLIDDLMNLNIRKLKKMDRVFIRLTKTKDGEDSVLFLRP